MYRRRNTSGHAGECVKAGFESFYFHTVFQFCSDKCFLKYRPGALPLAGLASWNVKRFFFQISGVCLQSGWSGLISCVESSTKWKLLLVLAADGVRQAGLEQDLWWGGKVMAWHGEKRGWSRFLRQFCVGNLPTIQGKSNILHQKFSPYVLRCVLGNSHVLQQVGWTLPSADSWERRIWNPLKIIVIQGSTSALWVRGRKMCSRSLHAASWICRWQQPVRTHAWL